ncbi:MAG: GNAT family N-acetyltransferase [Lachnospiraceae bacterium]|nr:GNAT family N-acetyltransferase [Lachnospiraceae bacterium]
MLRWIENDRNTDVYLSLRKAVNWKELSREQAEKALKNSMYILTAYENEEPVGMGRIVGDGAVICYVQDLIVIPEKQSDGIGGMILSRLKKFVEQEGIPGTTMMFDLMCAKGRENFYEKHGFIARPTENLGPGMIQYIDI